MTGASPTGTSGTSGITGASGASGSSGVSVSEADVCVVGAGPAGLALAGALADAGVRVVLVEGGREVRHLGDVLAEGQDAYPQDDVTRTRAGGLGGTAGIWSYRITNLDHQGGDPDAGPRGCRYAPMDPVDFEARAEVPHSGWPLTRADLDPWYERAQPVCGLGRYDYSPAGWSTAARQPLPLPPELVETQMFQFGPASAWTVEALGRLRAADGVRIITGARVGELETDAAGGRVTAVHWRGEDGGSGVVRARCTVLAAGGIENSRLLLLSDRHVRGGLGNGADQVGRCWMEHPLVRGGLLVAPAGAGLGGLLGLYDAHVSDGSTKVMAKLSIAPDLVRAEGLLSTSALLLPRDDVLASPAVQAYTAVRSPSGRRAGLASRAVTAARVLVGARDLLTARRVMATHLGLDHNGWSTAPGAERVRVFEVLHQTEQSPDPDNRIVLSDATDRFGRRLPVLRWRWTDDDRRRITRSRDLYGQAFARAGLGRMIQTDWDGGRPRMLGGNHHHMGGTRMSAGPRTGVVDADARVHGVTNLFVAGSSVFPAGGSVNPTLTVVALSLRLADHLLTALPTLPEA